MDEGKTSANMGGGGIDQRFIGLLTRLREVGLN